MCHSKLHKEKKKKTKTSQEGGTLIKYTEYEETEAPVLRVQREWGAMQELEHRSLTSQSLDPSGSYPEL